MIGVPWFTFPWTTATADLAHALVTSARDGDAGMQGVLDEIEAHARKGNKKAKKAWAYFVSIIKLVDAKQPPPSVIIQMRGAPVVGFNGGFPGGVPTLPWGYQSIWNYGFDPFVFEEMQANLDSEVGQNPAGFTMMFNPPTWPAAVGEPLPGEVEYEYEVGQSPFGAPGGVPLLPFGFGPFNYGYGGGDDGGGHFRSGPGMSEDIELEDRYI